MNEQTKRTKYRQTRTETQHRTEKYNKAPTESVCACTICVFAVTCARAHRFIEPKQQTNARALAEASVERENAVLCVGKKFESLRRCALLTAITAAAALCVLLLLLLLLLCNNRTRKIHINKMKRSLTMHTERKRESERAQQKDLYVMETKRCWTSCDFTERT